MATKKKAAEPETIEMAIAVANAVDFGAVRKFTEDTKVIADQIAAGAQIVIENDQAEAQAVSNLNAIHARRKALEEERQKISSPLDKAKKAADALFKPGLDAYDTAKMRLGEAIATYRAKRARDQQALLAMVPTTAAPAEARALVIAGSEPAPNTQGTRENVSYDVEIVDAGAVDRAYCVPSESLIKWAAKDHYAKTGQLLAGAGFKVTRTERVGVTGR